MKIQAPLDLCTFELSRFRIWNQSSTPNDFGFGTKYLNTNSGHEVYSREQIYTPTGWRTAAYLDDIDKINEKLDLIFGDELDTDTIIDSWKEVQDFLSGIEDTETLMTMLDGKAEWSIDIPIDNFKSIGYGTQSSDGWKFYGPAISFGANRNYYAQLQVNHQADQIAFRRHTTEGFFDWKNLIHEGNIKDYKAGDSAKLNGKEARYYMDSFMLDTGTDLNTNLVSAARPYIATLYDSNYPNQPDSKLANGNILHIASPAAQTAWELIAGFGSSSPLMFRCGTWKADGTGSINTRDWKTIAFTDSTVEAAYKLVKSTGTAIVTIDDNGTTNFAGSVAIAYNATFSPVYGIAWRIGETNITNVATGSTGNFILGNGGAMKGYKTYLDGGTLYFRTYKDGASQTAMTITDEGNVGIGNGTPIAPLTVAPKENANMQLGTTNGIVFAIQDKFQTYGINFNVKSTGVSNIQVGRTKDSATAYALNLNPLGGDVNVGSVGSKTTILGAATIGNKDESLVISLKSSSNSYIWDYSTSSALFIGLGNLGGVGSNNASLGITPYAVFSGYRNNAVDLGLANYRWRNVYSVEGNFSGNVRIANDYGLLSATTSGSVVQMVGITKSNALFVGTDACIVNKMSTNVYGSLINFYTGATLETRTKTMTLTSSGHVLIGGADDDADYALITKGNWKLTSTDKGNYFSIKLRDVNVDYYGYDAADSWCNHNFISNGTTRFFVAGRDAEWSYIKGKFRTYGEFRAEERATFNAGAYIPTGQKLTIGSVTFEEDADGRIKVDGNLYTTGTNASGGVGEKGETTGGGGSSVYPVDYTGNGVCDIENIWESEDLAVMVYERNSNNGRWDMILVDTSVAADRISVDFSNAPSSTYKIIIIA